MLARAVLALLLSCSTSIAVLRQVTLVFRHGERTPASTYKKDVYKNEDFFPYGWGQLTNSGKLQQYEQGKWLRDRYRNFLGEILTPTLIQAYSTSQARAQMSLSLMLAGLMPPTGAQIWNQNLTWQPFPWTVTGEQTDRLLLSTACPRIQEATEEVLKSPDILKYNKKHENMYIYLSEYTGVKVTTLADVFDIHGTLTAEKAYGLELPEWTKSVFPRKMEEVSAHHFLVNTQTTELKRLTGGRLLKKILEGLKSKIGTKQENPKMVAFSGHDSTVVNLLRALGIWEEQIPGYNILAIFELHQEENKDDWSMKVLLRNSTREEPHVLTIPGCSETCPFEEVVKLTEDVIPQDLETECKTKEEDFKPERPPSGP